MIEFDCLPYGVGHGQEGVCLRIRLGPHRVLLDCGLTNIDALLSVGDGQPPADFVICSHAHPDHARSLLDLHRAFPDMPIYASEVTSRLLPLNWREEPDVPLFCRALPWRSPLEIQRGLSVTLWPAGHLPGAAAVLLTYHTAKRDYTLFYTGDFLLSSSRLVEGLPLDAMRGLKPDVLILEGSYGTARHPHRRQQENQFAERIHRAIANGQSVIVQTPAMGLGQEILMLLRSHHHFTGRDLTIWVDEAIAQSCDAYLELLPHFPSTVQNFARHQPLFWDDRIRPYVKRLPDEFLKGDMQLPQPSVILMDENADACRYLTPSAEKWLLLLPEQWRRTPDGGRSPYDLTRLSPAVQAAIQSGKLQVDTYLLSEHCDGSGTTQLIHNLRPQHVIFVHGMPEYLSDLTSLEELQNRYHLHSPAADTVVELPIGETFLQPAPPDTRYEGELTEFETLVMVTLPESITSDARWQGFADTGLVEARWQGEELVLRGVSQRELLNQGTEPNLSPEVECCENCQHYRRQRCMSQASPLYGFRVSPEGYCPAFESLSASSSRDRREQSS